jgi:hypothetical protein
MKESYGEDLASHTDPESCTVARERRGSLKGIFAPPLPPPVLAGGRCPLAAIAAPPARCGGLRKRRAARRAEALRALDMRLRQDGLR